MSKLLYVDVPFKSGLRGGDKHRSRQLWDILSGGFEADLLVLDDGGDPIASWDYSGCGQFFTLPYNQMRYAGPDAIYYFSPTTKKQFGEILKSGGYDVVFFRFMSSARLGKIVEKTLPQAKIVFDVDMIFSRISELSWAQQPTLKNRYHLLEKLKLKWYEKHFFRKPFIFLFTNPAEMAEAERRAGRSAGEFHVAPNMMTIPDKLPKVERGNTVLFFGVLNSVANLDALDFMLYDLAPVLSPVLQENNAELRIVGKAMPPDRREKYAAISPPGFNVIGEVDDIHKEIASAKVVLLPLRVASGTLTRILESGALRTAVVTSKIGAEGFTLEQPVLPVGHTPEQYATLCGELLNGRRDPGELGEALFARCREEYSQQAVGEKLIKLLKGENDGG